MTTLTVLAKRGPFSAAEIAAARDFAAARGFDLVHLPGMERGEANRRIRLSSPLFYDGFRALLGPGAEDFVARYRFDIAAATDDRPYFHDVFRWATLPELVALGPAAGAALIELGELIVAATLAQATALGVLLVLLPLRLRLAARARGGPAWRFGLYFAALGFAFLFIEIAWIQKFVLFLGHPLYSVAVVLAAFLVFAGVGAGASTWLERRLAGKRVSPLDVAIGGIVAVALLYQLWLPGLFATLSGLPEVARVLAALALIAPLAFFMGMPFPLGLARIAVRGDDFVPWAWGLNGCASVASAAAATLVTMEYGANATVMAGVALYVAALPLLRRAPPAGPLSPAPAP